MKAKLTGIAAAEGYGLGTAYYYVEPDLTFTKYEITSINEEIARLNRALMQTESDLRNIRDQVLNNQGEETADIFHAHTLVLKDPELLRSINRRIEQEHMNAEYALHLETNRFITMVEQLDDEYMRDRAADIKDVKRRILAHLLNKVLPDLSLLELPAVIVAKDLAPSDMAQVNQKVIQGVVTDSGGQTSHAAIMARLLGIPAVINTKEATAIICHGQELLVDGNKGIVSVNPSQEEKEFIIRAKEKSDEQRNKYQLQKNRPTMTKDGHRVRLSANIGAFRDMETVLVNDAEGVGLYRTELLYMEQHHFPTEDEQFIAYRHVLETMGKKKVIMRTIDIGGDKSLDYWQLPEDSNPSLGERAIRLALNNEEIFRTQLRALLRASPYGNIHIMFPMIATLEELRKAKRLIDEEKEKLIRENIQVSPHIPVGMMVETPASAIMAEQFVQEADFFSIGTNDLIQYTFAADRMNEAVSYLYQPYHPAILKLLRHVIHAAHQEGKQVSMCGEMAGDMTSLPLLIGLGLDEFSVNPSSILQLRAQISTLNFKEMQLLSEKACTAKTSDEVFQLISVLYQ